MFTICEHAGWLQSQGRTAAMRRLFARIVFAALMLILHGDEARHLSLS
jgi:hypothetical protein